MVPLPPAAPQGLTRTRRRSCSMRCGGRAAAVRVVALWADELVEGEEEGDTC